VGLVANDLKDDTYDIQRDCHGGRVASVQCVGQRCLPSDFAIALVVSYRVRIQGVKPSRLTWSRTFYTRDDFVAIQAAGLR
jgi:hypothetical protein